MDELLFVPGDGPPETWGFLYRLDPRAKLLAVLALVLYLAFFPSPSASLIVLAVLHVLCCTYRTTCRRLRTFWGSFWPLAATLLLLASLRWRAEDPLLAVGPVSVTWASLGAAVGLAARIAALSLGVSLLLWTAEPPHIVAGLTRLGLPFELGFPVVMALQYVGTFRRWYEQTLEAQQSRGLLLPRGNPVRAARTYLPVLVPLIIHALRSADSLAVALQSRGFDSPRPRTSRRTLCFRALDWGFLLGTAALLAALALAGFDRTGWL